MNTDYSFVMKNMRILFLLFSLFPCFLFGQSNEYIVFLKGKEKLTQNKFAERFSPRAQLQKSNYGYDFYDLPVSNTYLSELLKEGEIINVSRWLNAVHLSSVLNQTELVDRFSFIDRIIIINQKERGELAILETKSTFSTSDSSSYGNAFEQLEITKTISCLHDNGLDGTGVLIAVLDAGFPELDSMKAFETLRNEGRIIDTWDFEDNACFVYHKNSHGTLVSSVIAAQLDSNYLGTAPKADYAFYLTEIGRFERNVEEFNLILGLERADSIGADICSISLGYRNFDTLQVSYSYNDMNGSTTIAVQGVNIAKRKGIIISVAAGNSGSGAGTLSSPCDADSVLCVGAIKYDSTRAGFSSEGPTSDGRIKPDVVTIGQGCWFVGLDDTARFGNGTSFATPLITGMVACLKQAHPNRSSFEIMDAVRNNSDRASNPDNIYGWGIPNSCKVDSALAVLDSIALGINELEKSLKFSIYPNPTNEFITVNTTEIIESISIIQLDGKLVTSLLPSQMNTSYKINLTELPKGIYIIRIQSQDGRVSSKKLIKQ